MKVEALRSMNDVCAAISEARLAWIERVRAAFLDCESCDMGISTEVETEKWERLSEAICAPCRLRDGITAHDA